MTYYPIKEIQLKAAFEPYTVVGKEPQQKVLGTVAKINIFVGPNNSGKSRLLRTLAAQQALIYTPLLEPGVHEAVVRLRQEADRAIQEVFTRNRIEDANDLGAKLKKLAALTEFSEGSDELAKFIEFIRELSSLGSVEQVALGRMSSSASNADIASDLKNAGSELLRGVPPEVVPVGSFTKFQKVYIPTLRSLRKIDGSLEDRCRKDYFPEESGPTIFTGESLYTEIRSLLLGDLVGRERIQKFQRFIGTTFFNGQEVALIPKENQDVLDIKIGDEKELPVHYLGDGIQAILTLTFPLFRHENEPLLVFMEEPELFLHPGLQRILLEVLTRSFPQHQFFIATHSNHLLDLTLDMASVSVFTVRKQLESGEGREREAHFEIENVSSADTRTLELLGVRNSSVFLTNCNRPTNRLLTRSSRRWPGWSGFRPPSRWLRAVLSSPAA